MNCEKCDKEHPLELCPWFDGLGRGTHDDAKRQHAEAIGKDDGHTYLEKGDVVKMLGDNACLWHSLT